MPNKELKIEIRTKINNIVTILLYILFYLLYFNLKIIYFLFDRLIKIKIGKEIYKSMKISDKLEININTSKEK